MFVADSNVALIRALDPDPQKQVADPAESSHAIPHTTPYIARSLACVPTMGALHEGHATLIRTAAAYAKLHALSHVVVTIFVNPTQFNDPADFQRYPKTLEADLKICAEAGATGVFVPSVTDIYGEHNISNIAKPAEDTLPPVAREPKLEDAQRPGHFAGVCQVVRRLFDLLRPAAAHFGEKDWQQLQVITQMTALANLPTRILPVPTVREPGGLAMSSRNRFLSEAQRTTALAISRALRECTSDVTPAEAERTLHRVLLEYNITPQYATVRHAHTLLPFADPNAPLNHGHNISNDSAPPPARALIAAQVGSVRLIDNDAWGI
jgi:pantoate--beta-alanine ligase